MRLIPFLISILLCFACVPCGFCDGGAQISLSKIAGLYRWKGNSEGFLRFHYDEKSSYNKRTSSFENHLKSLSQYLERTLQQNPPKAIDIFMAPSSSRITMFHIFPEKWTILSGWSSFLEEEYYISSDLAMVKLFLLNSSGTGMRVHPYVVQGLTNLIYSDFLHKRKSGNSLLEGATNRYINAHKLLLGRSITDGVIPSSVIGPSDMNPQSEYEKLRCNSFFLFLREQVPNAPLQKLIHTATVPSVTGSLLFSRFKSAVKKVTGHSLSTLCAGWKEVLTHESPHVSREHKLYVNACKILEGFGEDLDVLLPYRMEPSPQFAGTSKTGEFFHLKASSRGFSLELIKRHKDKNAQYKSKSARTLLSMIEKSINQNKSTLNLSTLNTHFQKRVSAINAGDKHAFDDSYSTGESPFYSTSPVNPEKDLVQLRSLEVTHINVVPYYDVYYTVNLGKANGIEKRKARFQNRNGKWKLLTEDVISQ